MLLVVLDPLLSGQEVRAELAYAFEHAERAPGNESPWNYVRGFFRAGGRKYADFPQVKERAVAIQVRVFVSMLTPSMLTFLRALAGLRRWSSLGVSFWGPSRLRKPLGRAAITVRVGWVVASGGEWPRACWCDDPPLPSSAPLDPLSVSVNGAACGAQRTKAGRRSPHSCALLAEVSRGGA